MTTAVQHHLPLSTFTPSMPIGNPEVARNIATKQVNEEIDWWMTSDNADRKFTVDNFMYEIDFRLDSVHCNKYFKM